MSEYNPKDFEEFQIQSMLLLASRMFNEYLSSRNCISIGRRLEFESGVKKTVFPKRDMEPEYFAEQWLKENTSGGTQSWRDGILEFFTKLLINFPTVLKEREKHNDG